MRETGPSFSELNNRSREIFRQLVEQYLETGEPVGSRNLSRRLPIALSPASVRNVMSDLEDLGLIFAPHTSAGRLPTDIGLRFFVDAILEFGNLSDQEQSEIEAKVSGGGAPRAYEAVLEDATNMLSGLSRGAGLVLTAKSDQRLRHIEFVRLEPTKALVVMVAADGGVENRILTLPAGTPASSLIEASNFLNSHIRDRTLTNVRAIVEQQLKEQKAALDALTAKVIEAGLAIWSDASDDKDRTLIVRGQANLLGDLNALEDLERIRLLLADLERKNEIVQLLELAEKGEGVRIFIGSENKLFSLSGSSLVLSPYRNEAQQIVGVLGVIGPTRLNYARIVPVVDYTANLIGRLAT